MRRTILLCVLAGAATAMAADEPSWWNPQWQYRTTVTRSTPYRDAAECPVEVAVDLQRLLQCGGVKGRVAPASVRVVERSTKTEVPAACRSEFNVPRNWQELYLAWYARPQLGQCGAYDVYFNTQDRPVPPASYRDDQLPSENLLANPGGERSKQIYPFVT